MITTSLISVKQRQFIGYALFKTLFKGLILCFLLLASTTSFAQNITTIAGNGIGGFSGDGSAAISSQIQRPYGLAFDASGNIYFADSQNHRVRKISANGVISTVAGTGIAGYNGDGIIATSAHLNFPLGVAVDASGNLYIADRWSYRIRKVSTNGVISTIVGNGTFGFSGDGGPAISAQVQGTVGITLDKNGNIYLSDGNRVRNVNANGIITTIAGNGTFDVYSEDGVPATSTQLANPTGLAVDADGTVYIAEEAGHRIRKVSPNGYIFTVTGDGEEGYENGRLNYPTGVAVDADGSIYIADTNNSRILKGVKGRLNIIAGNGIKGFSGDRSAATDAQLSIPNGVTVDMNGNIYIADSFNHRIRKVGTLSSNADLSSLTLSTSTFTPAFTASTTSYNATVAYDVTSITIIPSLSELTSTVSVKGTATGNGSGVIISLNEGNNVIPIIVIAQDGTIKTYTITITRSAPVPAPTIATQPTNTSVCPGSSASFTVAANNAVSYQWQVFTTTWQNVTNNSVYSGATTNKLTIANTTDLHNKQYRCVITGNSSSEAISQAVTLSAADVTKPAAVARNITVTLGANGTATITPEQVNNNSTDNCGIQAIALSKTSFSCENVGANTVTLTVTDKSGNTNTATATVTVQKAPQTITFNALAASTYGAAPITLNATATSGSAIVYTVTGPATINGNALTITGAGEVRITATQPGTGCYEVATPVTQTMQVEKATATITLNDLEQPENGQPRVVTATTAPAGLAVTITYDGKPEAPSLQGNYAVVVNVTDQNYTGSATATLTVQAPTGLGDDLKELKGVSLYPNPTRGGKLHLELDNVIIKNSLLVEVYSASGRLVRSMHIRRTTPTELDLSSHAAGLYLVRVTNGKEVKTIKVHKL